ncbi:MAG: LacI family DNA-binding transcriptional regulator [Bacillota bacterium]
MKEITMSDIAKIAGVSKSTVSRALNNDSRVNENTKREIKNIAEKYNYRPHKLAQALAKKHTNIIAVVLPTFPRSVSDPFFLEFLQGISEIAFEYGYSLTIPPVNSTDIDLFKKIFENITADGVILTEPNFNDPRIEFLNKKNIPFVFNGNPRVNEDICWIDTDNRLAAYTAVEYLIKKGHKNIATITGSMELVAGKYRLQGYLDALEDYNIEIKEKFIINSNFTEEGAYLAAEKLINFKKEISAVFAANDLMALGIIKAFKEAGIRIPEDIAVIGYDGIKLGEFVDPALTTIRNPSIEKGKKALELLIRNIKDGDSEKKNILLPSELIIRDSA